MNTHQTKNTHLNDCVSFDLSSKPRLKVACQFQINQRLQDPKIFQDYGDIFQSIATALSVKRHELPKKLSARYYYVVKTSSLKSKLALRRYFSIYPLLSSKHLDYRDWYYVDDLLRQKKHKANLDAIVKLKQGINTSRVEFTWLHLERLKLL